MKTSLGTARRLLVGHWLCYFSFTILVLRVATILWLESETRCPRTSAPCPLPVSHLICQNECPKSPSIHPLLFTPTSTTIQDAIIQEWWWCPSWSPWAQACVSVFTLQLERYLEDSHLRCRSLVSEPKPHVLASCAHHYPAPACLPDLKPPGPVCSSHATALGSPAPQIPRLSNTLPGTRVRSRTLQSPCPCAYPSCLPMLLSCPHHLVGLVNEGRYFPGSYLWSHICSSSWDWWTFKWWGFWGHLLTYKSKSNLYEGKSQLVYMAGLGNNFSRVHSLSDERNDSYLPQKKLRFLISGGIFMGSPWKLLTLNLPASSKVANLRYWSEGREGSAVYWVPTACQAHMHSILSQASQ